MEGSDHASPKHYQSRICDATYRSRSSTQHTCRELDVISVIICRNRMIEAGENMCKCINSGQEGGQGPHCRSTIE